MRTQSFPFHPPLFAAFPVLSIYSANLALIPLDDLWLPLLGAVALSLIVWLVATAVFRNIRLGATIASFVCGTLVLYGPITRSLNQAAVPIQWLVIVTGLAVLLAYKFPYTQFLNVLGTSLVAISTLNIVLSTARIALDESRIAHSSASGSELQHGRAPDVFYIILDGYGREDALKRVMRFDNSPFVEALRSRGFYVAERSRPNYVQTELSLSSSLNLSFVQTLLSKAPRNMTDRGPLDKLITQNALASFFRGEGYRTLAITTGFPAVKFPNADLWLQVGSNVSLFETTLLQMTPLVDDDKETESQFSWRRKALLYALQNLGKAGDPAERPKFVFAHILAPHPPFVFGPNGEPAPHKGPYGYWDGSDFYPGCGDQDDYRRGYVGQVEFLNGQVLNALDQILSHETTRPIIVVQGDHGSKLGLDQDRLEKTDVREVGENLAAFYVPEDIRAKLYPDITPVNEFRIILSCMFGSNLPVLPDRTWYSPYSTPLHFTDITDRVVAKRSVASSR